MRVETSHACKCLIELRVGIEERGGEGIIVGNEDVETWRRGDLRGRTARRAGLNGGCDTHRSAPALRLVLPVKKVGFLPRLPCILCIPRIPRIPYSNPPIPYLLHHARIQQSGSISKIMQVVFGDLTKDAAHDLAAAGFWKTRYKLDLVRLCYRTDDA